MSFVSSEYKSELSKLHKKSFGNGKNIPDEVHHILKNNDIKTFLDFGCGKGKLSESIKQQYPDIKVYSYDPITSPIELPRKVDMVYTSDVLEHIELEYIDQTLEMLFRITQKFHYHLIACHPAKKKLSDGRNAHLIIEEPNWWADKLKKFNWNVVLENVVTKTLEKKDRKIENSKYIVVLSNTQ